MNTLHPLADACPSCFPGDYPAVTPSSVTPDVNSSLCAEYTHPACGTSWAAWWDAEAAGVPLQRAGAHPEPSSLTIGVWREAVLRVKARLQAEESRRERAGAQRRAS